MPAHSLNLAQPFFDKTQDYATLPPSVKSRLSPLWLLVVSKIENSVQKVPVRQNRENFNKCDECTEGDSENWLPKLLHYVESPISAELWTQTGYYWDTPCIWLGHYISPYLLCRYFCDMGIVCEYNTYCLFLLQLFILSIVKQYTRTKESVYACFVLIHCYWINKSYYSFSFPSKLLNVCVRESAHPVYVVLPLAVMLMLKLTPALPFHLRSVDWLRPVHFMHS